MDKQAQAVLFSSTHGEYVTPDWVFDPLNEHFHFTLDAAASHENFRVPVYYTQDGLYSYYFSTPGRRSHEDGLVGSWSPGTARGRVWLNPPYGRGVEAWVRKCATEMPNCKVIVALLPARTDTSWFHRWVAPYATVYFLMGRINFVGMTASAPFPSILAIYRNEEPVPRGHVVGHTLDLKSGGFSP